MHILRILLLWTVCGLAGQVSSVAAAQRATPSILDFITLWLDAEYHLGVPGSHPEIIALPAAELIARRYGAGADVDPDEIVALYDADAGAIFVSDSWTGGTLAELSVLVHEMVHHLQEQAGTVFACPAAREELAYRAQSDWLGLFGQNLETAFGVDPALILVATACIH